MQSGSLLVQDVIFENAVHACVGIGLRNHYTLEFRGCEFHATLRAQRNILVNRSNPANLVTMSKWDGRDEGQDGLLGSYAWTLEPTSTLNTATILNTTQA